MLVLVALGQWYLISGLGQGEFIYHINDGVHFVLNLFLVHGMDSSFNGPSWSISTEFVVNLVFFLIILLPRRLAFAAFLVAIAFTFVPRAGALELATPFIRTLRGFCIGVLLHWAFVMIAQRPRPWLPRVADGMFVLSVAGIIAYGYLVGTNADLSGGVALALFCSMVLSAPLSSIAAWSLCRAPLVYLGEISYSVYLTHFPLQLALWIAYVTLGITWPFGDLAGLIAFLALTVGCAALTYRYVELPGKRLLKFRRKGYVDAIA
jgi:peptidoglycan/LPS O-acetylase OafA/YrhL